LLQNETHLAAQKNDKVRQYNQAISSQTMATKVNREDTFQVGYIDSCKT